MKLTTCFRLVTVCAAFVVLAVSRGESVEAAKPPYVPPVQPGFVRWDPNLIPQKLAQTFQADPPFIKDGRFYDVGRNPKPKGLFPPSIFGDWRFRVTHIKFDWKTNSVTNPDGTVSATYDEGHTLMYQASQNLAHVNDDKTKGEWIYKYDTHDPDAGRSEPGLYVTNKNCQIMVRIECAAPVKYAYVGAKEMIPDYPQGGSPSPNWLHVQKMAVAFSEKMPGSLWVSKGDQTGTDAQGNPVFSEYVAMSFDGNTKAAIDRSDFIWQWYVDRVNSTDELAQANPGNEWTAAVVSQGTKDGWAINKSGEYGTQTITDSQGNPLVVEVVLPHRCYTILDKSKYPWYDAADGSDAEGLQGQRKPWVSALDFAIVTPQRTQLKGYTSLSSVASRVTTFCYNEFGMEYSHKGLPALYVYTGGNGVSAFVSVSLFEFLFANWIADPIRAKVINCHDQALAVTTLISLIGGDAKYTAMEPFGYVNPSDFVGPNQKGNDCNNPFFERTGDFVVNEKVGLDDTCWRTTPIGERNRSLFNVHAWSEFASLVYDATAGDALSNGPRIALTRAAFKTAAIDLSNTAVNPWEDNEELAAAMTIAPGTTALTITPAKDPGPPASDAPNPNYKNGDMTKAAYHNFTLK